MTDPVSRAARRQNLLDRLAELLTGWGCPGSTATDRAGAVLAVAEDHGWTLPSIPAPPIRGRGSTPEGRARSRLIYEQTRLGCRCGLGVLGEPADLHRPDCPVYLAWERAENTPSAPQERPATPPGHPLHPPAPHRRSCAH